MTGRIVPNMVHANDGRKQLLYAMLGFTFGQLLLGSKPLAAQDDCKLVLDAMTKLFGSCVRDLSFTPLVVARRNHREVKALPISLDATLITASN